MIDEKLLIETMQWKMREAGTSDWNKCLDEVERFIREQPQVGGIEIDKDFETILIYAVRYAIGRRAYIPPLVIDYITPLLPYLSENTLRLIANEITEHEAYEGGLGDEKIDKPYWIDFLRKIRLEMEGRNEP